MTTEEITTDKIKAVIDHACNDLELLATALDKPEIAASIRKFKELAESPLSLEMLKMAIEYGRKKLSENSGSAS